MKSLSIINPEAQAKALQSGQRHPRRMSTLLKQFEMMQKMMKQFKKSPKGFCLPAWAA